MSQTIFKKERDPSILILDFGSQYSELMQEELEKLMFFLL